MPSGRWKPDTTPSADNSASRLPESTSISGAADALGLGDEDLAVLGVAAGGSRDRQDLASLQAVAQRAKASERRQRLLDRIGGQQSRRLHLTAEPAQYFLVEDRGRTAGQPLVDHQPHRVRADIDDGNRRPVIETTLRHIHCKPVSPTSGRDGV